MTSNNCSPRPVLLHSQVTHGMQQEFHCILCHDIPIEVPCVTPCSHMYCRTCITEALAHRPECPVCRQALTPQDLSPIAGILKRVWEQVGVKCPDCSEWTGTIGNFPNHVRCCSSRGIMQNEEVERLERRCQRLEQALDECREDYEIRLFSVMNECNRVNSECQNVRTKLNEAISALPGLDRSYQYNRHNVVELSKLICHHLENKPSDIDSNRIFNCVVSCCNSLKHQGPCCDDSLPHLYMDTRMLLAVCLASTWFTPNQLNRLRCFLSELF